MTTKEKFLEYLELKNLGPATLNKYMWYFGKLDPELLQTEGADYVMRWLRRHNSFPSRAMLKNFLEFAKSQPTLPKSIRRLGFTFQIPRSTGRKKVRLPHVLTREEVHHLARNMKYEREKFMVLCTYYLGLRCSELINLQLGWFDWDKKHVNVIGKGDKERMLPMVPELQVRLREYFQGQIARKADFDRCFPVSIRYWQQVLSKTSRRVMGRSVNPHLLRHSCGSYLHQRGLSLKEIADFLGHTSVNTTQIYVHLDKDQLEGRIMEAFSTK